MKRIYTFLICSLLLTNQHLSAQVLGWEYEPVLNNTHQSGGAPDMMIAEDGSIHISCWDVEEDKLKYVERDANTGQWSVTNLDTNQNAGFRSAIAIDANQHVHIAYYANLSGESRIKYATNASGTWQIEDVAPNMNLGLYGASQIFDESTKLSVDIEINPQAQPVISFFDATIGNYDASCSSNIYDLDMILATKRTNGTWALSQPDVVSNQVGCLFDGDRFGEFCKVVDWGGEMNAFSISLHNSEVLRFSPPNSSFDTVAWNYETIDASTRFLPSNEFLGTFEYLDASVANDTMIHLAYGYSTFFGADPSQNYQHYFASLDTAGNMFIHDFDAAVYRTNFSIASKGADSIYLAFYNQLGNLLSMRESVDGGNTWINSSIFSTFSNADAPLEIFGDSLYIAIYDGAKDQIVLGTRLLNGGAWQFQRATISEETANFLDAAVDRTPTDDIVHIAFDEENEDRLYVGERLQGNWTFLPLDEAELGTRDIQVGLSMQDEPIVAFVQEDREYLKLAERNGGNWNIQLIDSTDQPRNLSMKVHNDTVHIVYFEFGERSLKHTYAAIGSSNWTQETIDAANETGLTPSLFIDSLGTMHVAYIDFTFNLIRYAYKPIGGSWNREAVTDSFVYVPASPSIYASPTGENPKIAFYSSGENNIRLLEKQIDGSWTDEIVQNGGSNFLGNPLELVVSPLGYPWILYNYTTGFNQLRLVRRDPDEGWRAVSVLGNNDPKIADIFRFLLVDSDFYIVGRQNEAENEGIGLLYSTNGLATTIPEQLSAESLQLKLYPNPAQSELFVQFQTEATQNLQIQLRDLQGKLISQWVEPQPIMAGEHRLRVDVSDLPAGMYFCEMLFGNNRIVKKFVRYE